MGLIYNDNFHKITFFISTEIAYKILYNNLAGGKTMEILRKKEFEEEPVISKFHEMILYSYAPDAAMSHDSGKDVL